MKKKVKVKPKLIKSFYIWFRYSILLTGFAVNILLWQSLQVYLEFEFS
jgi:hypothetical protein